MRWKIKANQRSWCFTCRQRTGSKFGHVQSTGVRGLIVSSRIPPQSFLHSITTRMLKCLTLIARIIYNIIQFLREPAEIKNKKTTNMSEYRWIVSHSLNHSIIASDFWSACLLWDGYDKRRRETEGAREKDIRHLEVRRPRSLWYSGLAPAITLILLRTFILD